MESNVVIATDTTGSCSRRQMFEQFWLCPARNLKPQQTDLYNVDFVRLQQSGRLHLVKT